MFWTLSRAYIFTCIDLFCCVCIYVHVSECMWVHVCACTCGGQRLVLSASLNHSPLIFQTGSLLDLELADWVDWLPSSLCLSSTGIPSAHHHTWLLRWCWGPKRRSSGVCSKFCVCWAIPSALFTFLMLRWFFSASDRVLSTQMCCRIFIQFF